MNSPPDHSDAVTRRATRWKSFWVAMSIALLVVGAPLWFSNIYGTNRIATNALTLHWTNSAVAAGSAVRSADAQAIFFGVDFYLEAASQEAFDSALEEARRTIADLEAVIEAAPESIVEDSPQALVEIKGLAAHATNVLDLVESGEIESAVDYRSGQFEPHFQIAMSELGTIQESVKSQVQDGESLSGWLSGVTTLFVTLLVPAAAVYAYSRIARRQVREREAKYEVRLETDRQLLESKDEFIASISHELRTPLTSIVGFTDILLEDDIDPTEGHELLMLVGKEAAELQRMVEDLLTAARLDASALNFEFEDVTIRDEIKAVADPLQRAGHSVAVNGVSATVVADRTRLRQVLRNLMSNAVRHGGPIIEVLGEVVDDKYRISVSDNGEGVGDEVVERLFQRFVHDGKASVVGGSVGLGLAIARSLAAEMGGDLRYERVDGWTVFTFELELVSIDPLVVSLSDIESDDDAKPLLTQSAEDAPIIDERSRAEVDS
ncbi:MAG: HAMP domain-containing histidine kinase [Acidimicrobiia bacterium]|nr:HAMP domain-containing histidine kinase [Acidimicrobiia bacterium]